MPASDFLARLGRNILYGFRRELRPYEASIIEAVASRITDADQATINAQLVARERVQRWNSDRMVLLSVPRGASLPLLSARNTDHCMAKVRVESPQGKLVAKLMSHRGLLSSLEFSKPPKSLLGSNFVVTSVELSPAEPGHDAGVDAEEHG